MEGLDSAPAIKPRSGDNDYRAYIGGPGRYDVLAAANFMVLVQAGLREKHRVLDVGCGSLRLGRLLIPYLSPGGYFGVEPNQWLVDEGFDRELGRDIIELKQPRFLYVDDFSVGAFETTFDYAIAYSVFSHAYPDLAGLGLRRVGETLAEDGVLLGTYFEGGPDVHLAKPDNPLLAGNGSGWLYPKCVRYSWEEFEALLHESGLVGYRFTRPDRGKQTWFAACRPGAERFALRAARLAADPPWVEPTPALSARLKARLSPARLKSAARRRLKR